MRALRSGALPCALVGKLLAGNLELAPQEAQLDVSGEGRVDILEEGDRSFVI